MFCFKQDFFFFGLIFFVIVSFYCQRCEMVIYNVDFVRGMFVRLGLDVWILILVILR